MILESVTILIRMRAGVIFFLIFSHFSVCFLVELDVVLRRFLGPRVHHRAHISQQSETSKNAVDIHSTAIIVDFEHNKFGGVGVEFGTELAIEFGRCQRIVDRFQYVLFAIEEFGADASTR